MDIEGTLGGPLTLGWKTMPAHAWQPEPSGERPIHWGAEPSFHWTHSNCIVLDLVYPLSSFIKPFPVLPLHLLVE
mgnify:CR=1 FL=1